MTEVLNTDRSRPMLIAAWVRSKISRRPGRARIEGFVDQVVAEEVYGWAFDTVHPRRRVLVTATAGGEVISEALADLPRKDLADAQKGDGRHGFRLRLPRDLSPEKRSQVRIEAVAKPRNVVLQRGEIVVPEPVAPRSEIEPVTSTRPSVGFLETFQGGVLRGWAVDPNHPTAIASVDIYDGEVFLGTVACDRERTKAAQAGARSFAFEMPNRFEAISGKTLRARISGTRLELKRSRNYPGDAPSAEDNPQLPSVAAKAAPPVVVPKAAPAPFETRTGARAELRARAALTAPAVDVLFLICGGSGPDSGTKASCAEQRWKNIRTVRADGDDAALRECLASSNIAVLLQEGQRVDPELAVALMYAPVSADVWSWLTPDRNSETGDPDISASLTGAFNGALAIRSSALGRFNGDLAATLARGDIDEVVRWTGAERLRWSRLAAPLSSGPVSHHPAPIAPAPAPPAWISLAVWTGWHQGLPPTIPSLLAQCGGLRVEILVPAAADRTVEDRLAELASPEVAALIVRRVDTALDGGAAALRTLCEGASGQVVVLCHGDVLLPEGGGALREACGWANHPRFGAVTIEISSGDGEVPLAGLTVSRTGQSLNPANSFEIERSGQPRPVLAAPPLFMVVSRSGLAAVGGLNGRHDGAAASIDLGIRMRRAGRVAALLGQHRGSVTGDAIRALLDPPFSPSALALMGDAAEKAAIDYPAPAEPG